MGEIELLLIEGNAETRNTLKVALGRSFSLNTASTGNDALNIINKQRIDLAILDLNIQDISGRELCRKIRSIGVIAPIFILTSNSDLKAKLDLFNVGADDVIVKPFSLGELEARLTVHKKRLLSSKEFSKTVETENLVLDKDKHSVTRDGYRTIELRKKEFAILEYLMMNPDKIMSRTSISTHVWNIEYKPWSNSLDVHVKNLRDKIDKPFKKQIIQTVHGYGYRLVSNK
jgi:DNA-binding response OmpR family regulator